MSVTGHAINVANFETVIIILTNLGATYNPSQPLIQLPALQTKLTEAQTVFASHDAAEAAKKVAVNERAAEFESLPKLATSVKKAAEVDVNDEAFTADLTTITRKFYGGRAGDKPVDDPSTPLVDESEDSRSVSERSYDNMVAFFADLIALVQTQPAYNPNETEVRVTTLETKLAALQTKNNAAKTAVAELGTLSDTRDDILYNPETGIIRRVNLIKKYIDRILGKDSAPYQQINALEFRRY